MKKRVKLSEFKKAIDDYINSYGDADVSTVSRHCNHDKYEYTIVLGDNLTEGINIAFERVE